MNDDIELHAPQAISKVADKRTSELERMREKLSRFMPRALEILEELAEGAENDRVRLAAAESILDRAGLGKTQTTKVEVSQAEHEIATNEAETLVARIAEQKQKQAELAATTTPKPSITTLMVLEGDDDTLPTTTAAPDAIEAEASE